MGKCYGNSFLRENSLDGSMNSLLGRVKFLLNSIEWAENWAINWPVINTRGVTIGMMCKKRASDCVYNYNPGAQLMCRFRGRGNYWRNSISGSRLSGLRGCMEFEFHGCLFIPPLIELVLLSLFRTTFLPVHQHEMNLSLQEKSRELVDEDVLSIV